MLGVTLFAITYVLSLFVGGFFFYVETITQYWKSATIREEEKRNLPRKQRRKKIKAQAAEIAARALETLAGRDERYMLPRDASMYAVNSPQTLRVTPYDMMLTKLS